MPRHPWGAIHRSPQNHCLAAILEHPALRKPFAGPIQRNTLQLTANHGQVLTRKRVIDALDFRLDDGPLTEIRGDKLRRGPKSFTPLVKAW